MIVGARNVHEALCEGVSMMGTAPRVPSRNGDTLEWPTPVLTVYRRPWERVLRCPVRDANPFFHFLEALWMLAGRNDVEYLSRIVARMAEYSDDGTTFHGAYGYRWRAHFEEFDQIEALVKLLINEPATRRAVLTMWDPLNDLGTTSKDLPCNTQVYFKVRDGTLRTTVTCRSNDMLWGAYGANAVHFSMLHEYMANRVGVQMGPLYQLSDSFHVYLGGPGGELWERLSVRYGQILPRNPYADGEEWMPLGAQDPKWDLDLRTFMDITGSNGYGHPKFFSTRWFKVVALPMWRAFIKRDAQVATTIGAEDWRRATYEWLMRRRK